jgi:hypothetical protein
MPNSQINELLDDITIENIDDALYFYSYLLEKIVSKKNKYEKNEAILMKGLKNMDIAKEITFLKLDGDTTSDSDSN